MRIFQTFLAIGLAALTVVHAGGDHRKPESETTFATLHTVNGIPRPLSPSVSFSSRNDFLPPNTVYKAQTADAIPKPLSPSIPFPTKDGFPPQARADHPYPLPDGPGGFPKPQEPPSVDFRDEVPDMDSELRGPFGDYLHNHLQESHYPSALEDSHNPTPDKISTLEDSSPDLIHLYSPAKVQAREVELKTSSKSVSHSIIGFPDGPAGYTYTHSHSGTTHATKTRLNAPEGPASFTHSHSWQSWSLSHETPKPEPHTHSIHPVERPNGPAGYTPTHTHVNTHSTTSPLLPRTPSPDTNIDNTSPFTLVCTGSSLSSPVRTCYGNNNKNTLLTGSWCAANCKCNSNGCISCDASKAAGCTSTVVTDTCKAVVRDWKCFCQGRDGTQSYC